MLKIFIFALLVLNIYVSGFNLVVNEGKSATTKEPEVIPEPVVIPEPEIRVEEPKNSVDNLCLKLNCQPGSQCVYVDDQPFCECIENCPTPIDDRLMVCSTSNFTYESECHYYREKCWCLKDDHKCTQRESMIDSIEYFGKCQSVDKCSDEQLGIFPSRMQLWLDEVLIVLNDRKDIDNTRFGTLVEAAKREKQSNNEHYWRYGVIFEFCQLDKSHDGVLNLDETKELIVPIKALENCIQPFLRKCDSNNDRKITDLEWGECLDLSADDIQLLRKACK